MTGQSNNSQGRDHDRLPNWNPKNGGMLISQPVTSRLTNHSELCMSRPRNNQSCRISIDRLQRRPSFGFESSTSMTSGDPVGVPLLECCCVDDTSPENTIVGLPPGWVDTDVCRLYIGINSPQPGGTRAPSRSPPVSWWSKRHTHSLMMIVPGTIWTCHEAKEVEPSCFNDTANWRATVTK